MVNQEAQLPQQQQRRQGRGGQRRPQPYCPSAPTEPAVGTPTGGELRSSCDVCADAPAHHQQCLQRRHQQMLHRPERDTGVTM